MRDVQREAGQASVEVEEQRFGPAFGVVEVGLLALDFVIRISEFRAYEALTDSEFRF